MTNFSDEPKYLQTEGEEQLGKLLNWYSYNCGPTESRKFILAYFSSFETFSTETLSKLKKVEISTTIGWLARIVTNSNHVPEKYLNRLKDECKKILEKAEKIVLVEEEKPQETKLNIQDYIDLKVRNVLGEIDDKLDNVISSRKFGEDFVMFFRGLEINQIIAKKVQHQLESKICLDIALALKNKTDEEQQCFEAYSFLGKDLIKFHKYLNEMLSSITSIANEKQIRKQRKKKNKSPIELVKKVKLLTQYEDYKVFQPEKIIGAEVLVVFNTKTRFVGIYECNNNHGFMIKGSTIQNFDEEKSISKKLRNPKEQLKLFVAGGNIAIRNSLSKIRAKEKRLNGRLNCDTIVLRVI